MESMPACEKASLPHTSKYSTMVDNHFVRYDYSGNYTFYPNLNPINRCLREVLFVSYAL